MAEDGLGGGMDVEGGGDEVEVWGLRAEAGVGKVAVLLEVSDAAEGSGAGLGIGEMVVANADPVVEALQGEVEVFVGFEFDDGEAVVAGDGEEIEHAAIEVAAGAGEGGDLGVDGGGFELWIEGGEVGAEGAFEPALRLGAEEDVLGRVGEGGFGGGGDGAAAIEEVTDELTKVGAGAGEERGFAGAGADGDLELTVEGLADEGGADTGELEAVEEEGELGAGAEAELAGGGAGDGVGVAVSGAGLDAVGGGKPAVVPGSEVRGREVLGRDVFGREVLGVLMRGLGVAGLLVPGLGVRGLGVPGLGRWFLAGIG